VPTTLSSGEFNARAGITHTRLKLKQSFVHRAIVPESVILDPTVTVHTPEWLWLSSGVRAIDHAVETLLSLDANDYTDGTALQALRALGDGLPGVKEDANNLEARLRCMMGAWLSMVGIVSGTRLGASHAIGHILGGSANVPHGHTSCIMLPWVMRWNKSANADRQALIANAMGHPGKDAGDVLDDFIRGLGMPRSLSEVKIGKEHFDRIAQQAMGTPWVPRNPRKIDGPAEVKEILELAA